MTSANDRLSADLRALPQLAPPPDLTGRVMARIARIEPVDVAVTESASTTRASSVRGPLVHAAAGIAIVLPAYAVAILIEPIKAMAVQGAPTNPSLLSMTTVLVATLALYAIGLYLPLTGRRRTASSRSSD